MAMTSNLWESSCNTLTQWGTRYVTEQMPSNTRFSIQNWWNLAFKPWSGRWQLAQCHCLRIIFGLLKLVPMSVTIPSWWMSRSFSFPQAWSSWNERQSQE
jgi:hypothetical protein